MYDTSPCGPLDGKLMINKTKGYLFFTNNIKMKKYLFKIF